MGAIDQFFSRLNIKGNNDSADDYYDDYDEDEEYEVKPKKSLKDAVDKQIRTSKVTSIGSNKKKQISGSQYELELIKPTSMEDAKNVTNSLLDGKAVILNLSFCAPDLARDVLNFSFGSAYALNGQAKPITNSIYVLVPEGVDISGFISENDDNGDEN